MHGTAIAAEDARPGARRNLQVRSSYYPRTLIALGDWPALERLLAQLAADPAKECRAAAATFGVVASIHRNELAAARAPVAAIRGDAAGFPDHQSWAVLAQFTLMVEAGESGENSTHYAIAGVPTLVVIDREGIVRYMSCGAVEPGLFRIAVAGVLAVK